MQLIRMCGGSNANVDANSVPKSRFVYARSYKTYSYVDFFFTRVEYTFSPFRICSEIHFVYKSFLKNLLYAARKAELNVIYGDSVEIFLSKHL